MRPNVFAPPLSAADLGGGGPVGEAPRELRIATFLWLGVAFLLLVGAVFTFSSYDAALDAARSANSGLTEEQLKTGVQLFLGVFVFLDLLFAGLFVLFAIKLKAGRSWARLWLMILGAVVFFVQVLGLSVLSIIVGLLIIGGFVTMNLRPSSDFINAQRAA